MSEIERRALIKGAGLGALAFSIGGTDVFLTPREARAQNAPFRTLNSDQVAALEAIGETLVPGAQAAGIAHFVDQQISRPPEEALLEARILNVRPPYANFYRAALAGIDNASRAQNGGRAFAQLSDNERIGFVDAMRGTQRAWRPALEERFRAGAVERDGAIVVRADARAAAWAFHGVAREPSSRRLPELAKRDVPVLLLRSDTADDAEPLRRFVDVLPQAEVRTLHGGHDLLADAPEDTIAAVADFVHRATVAAGAAT